MTACDEGSCECFLIILVKSGTLLFLVCSISLASMHQLCFLHMLNYPVMDSLSLHESGSKHARNYVYLSKIENCSYHPELVSHPIPEHVDKLSSSVRIKLH